MAHALARRAGSTFAGVVLVVGLGFFYPAVSHADTLTTHDILWFGDTAESSISAGPNQVIRASGTISNTTLCGLGGTNDFIFPAADVYIVKPGSEGGGLKEAGGGSPATVISASAGGYLDEILGVTSPGGTLGEGTYDVVVDECQDGRFDPAVDSAFPNAVTVAFPPVIPSYTGYIGDIKAKAAKNALQWLYASVALDALRGELGMSDLANVENDNPDASSIRQVLDKIVSLIALVKSPLPSGGPWDVIGSGVNAAINEVKHYDAIAADPPDADYKHPVALPKITTTLPSSPDAPVAAIEALAAPAQVENAVTTAFLNALERYQGARVAGNAAWALVHAREVASLARLLAAAQTRSAVAATTMSTALGSLPGFTALHQESGTLAARIQMKGFTGTEIQALRNLGYTTTEIEGLRSSLPGQVSCNNCWYSAPGGKQPPYPNTTAGLQAALADLATAESDAAASSTALATRVDGVIAELAAQSSVPRMAPTADAGGPYTATADAKLTLDASASAPGTGGTIVSYAWDTDGDGQFDDATGATPTVTVAANLPGLVGVKVSGSDGQVAIAYAPVTVHLLAPPSITAQSPASRFATVTVGTPATFSVSGNVGSADWTLDGVPIVGVMGQSYAFTATTGQVGAHILAVTLTGPDQQRTSTDWAVQVLAADGDRDGWTATADCDDHDGLVNPGRPEVIGNGVDDDCDPATSDTPLSDYTGQAVSWGSTHAEILGRRIGTGTDADTPSNITGLSDVAQLAAGADMGVAADTDGAVWTWGTGAGNQWNTPAPVAVPDPSGTGQLGKTGAKATAITSDRQSAALLADGTVVAWGDNGNGALGTGSSAGNLTTPGYVRASDASRLTDVTQVVAGSNFLALATGGGGLYVTGGVCGTTVSDTAQPVTGLGGKVVQVAAGTGHLLILLDNGDLYGCGTNDHGQLGPGSATIGAPQQIALPAMTHPAELAAGSGFSVVLDTDGVVWAFGRNDNGQLGNGTTDDTSTPTKVDLPGGATITQLAAGGDTAAIVRADGSVQQWGHGTTAPTALTLPAGVRIAHLALDTTGTAHYAIATRADAVIGWGDFGPTGSGGPGSPGGAPSVLDLPGLRDVATTGWDSVGITDDGRVLSWGNGGDQLGGGATRKGGPIPQPVLDTGGAPGSQLYARSVQGFGQAFDAQLDNGTAAVWGDWVGGWQDPGVTDTQYFPILIPDSGGTAPISGVTQLMLQLSGARYLLRSDGSVWSWYGDGPAQCRPDAPEATYLPHLVTALGTDNKQIAASHQGAGLFLKKDGSLYSCGNGSAPVGRVITGGNDAWHDDPNPGQVQGMGPGSVTQVSADLEQALALKTDGTVWAWGRNDNCSIVCTEPDYSDDNTTVVLPKQVPLPAGPPVVSVTACLSASYAIRADGSVLAWGYDGYNSLGLTDPSVVVSPPNGVPFVPKPTAVAMPGGRPVWKIACGNQGGGYRAALALVGDPVAHLADPDQIGIAASVADASVTEGKPAKVTVSLSHPSGLDLTLQYATSDGTAAAGSDYTASSGAVTIPAGQTSATISVPTTGNDTTQPDRAFTVTISDPATSYGPAPWLSISDAEARVTINDDDPMPVASIGGPAAPVTEGTGGGALAQFTVSLDHPSASPITVDWATNDGTATAPSDYLPAHASVTIAPGATSAPIDVEINGDTALEPDETFSVTLSHPANATLGTASATATIADDEPVVVSASDSTAYSPVSTAKQVAFTIAARQILAGETVTVPWHAASGTATVPDDVIGSGTVTLTHDHPTATVTVTVTPAPRPGTEFYRVAIEAATDTGGRQVIATPGTGTILVSNTPPTLTLPVSLDLPWAGTMQVTGSFTDPDSASWTATVDYGDGPKPLALTGKTFALTHNFSGPGSHQVKVGVCDDTGGCGDATMSVLVGQVTTIGITASEGAPFTTTLATFTLPDPTATPADFAATINWGDGATSDAAITADPGGGFDITGGHTYAEEGHYQPAITVRRVDDPANTSHTTVAATVTDAPLSATGTNLTSANPVTGTVATFTDADPKGDVSDYTATINWDDGEVSDGMITAGPGNGFDVTGTHIYTDLGPHTATTHICDIGGACAQATSHLLVYATTPGGFFVIGDHADTSGTVTFWGNQWAKTNTLSAGPAPAAFKGFAANGSGALACGATWTTQPGNSPKPPTNLPAYIAVVIASHITKHGNSITGDLVHIAIVKTNPGYKPDPGHPATGNVVATLC